MGGESASCVSDRSYYGPTNATSGHVTSDDDSCVVSAWQSAATNAWDSGNFGWTGHDCEWRCAALRCVPLLLLPP